MMLGLGAWLAIRGEVTPGIMIAASILLGRALAPIDQAVGQWPVLQSALRGRRSLVQLLRETPEELARTPLPEPQALLETTNLVVGAPGAEVPAVKGVSFRLEPGQAVGIAGPSASGKSTLARGLAGVWPPLAGKATLAWPDDPAEVAVTDIDFEALAHVLANCCRRGGRMRQYHSLAGHAVIVSEEIEALDGLEGEDRRTLALHALVAGAASAWFRGVAPFDGEWAGSARAADRTARLAAGIEAAVREAAGLDPVLDEERAELLRFVGRMAAAAETRDLMEPGITVGAGISFPPLKRRIRPVPPDKAARDWLKRFRALGGNTDRPAAGTTPDGNAQAKPDAGEA